MAADGEALAQLLEKMGADFRLSLSGRLAEIEAGWGELTRGTPPAGKFEALQRLVHMLAGSAKIFGMPAVSAAARAVELALVSLEARSACMTDEDAAHIGRLLEVLRQSSAES
jgi:HPt (histidine-containing phosphotransfer) domain-containing protein